MRDFPVTHLPVTHLPVKKDKVSTIGRKPLSLPTFRLDFLGATCCMSFVTKDFWFCSFYMCRMGQSDPGGPV